MLTLVTKSVSNALVLVAVGVCPQHSSLSPRVCVFSALIPVAESVCSNMLVLVGERVNPNAPIKEHGNVCLSNVH